MLRFAYEVASEQDTLHLRVDSQAGLISAEAVYQGLPARVGHSVLSGDPRGGPFEDSADLPRYHPPHALLTAHHLGGGGCGGGDGGGSGDVSKRIASGHRVSTRAIYDSRWHTLFAEMYLPTTSAN